MNKIFAFKVILLTAIEYLREDKIEQEEIQISRRGSASQINEHQNSLATDPTNIESVDAWPHQGEQKNRRSVRLAQRIKTLGKIILIS